MNPFPLAWASLRRNSFTAILFATIVALAVALGIAISAQERALRTGSARAADKFDLIVAAPGSHNDVLFSTVYLDATAVELLDPAITALLLDDQEAEIVAPIGFGDHIEGAAVVGTTAAFVDHLSGGLADGRLFEKVDETVVGALSPHAIGDRLEVSHSHGAGGGADADVAADAIEAGEAVPGEDDHPTIVVVGRMQPTGTPWDRAIVVPIEYNWVAHGLGTGHRPDDTHIGPPFDQEALPGVPAVVVKPTDVAAAYGLRNAYRTPQSTAFFPAEVLVELYGLLGNATAIMGALTLAAQGLVVAAILAGVVAILDLQRQRFAVLRALGASPIFICATVWVYVATIVLGGALVGLCFGWGLAAVVSDFIAQSTGVSMRAEIGARELSLVSTIVGIGLVLALVPAMIIYRRPVVEALR
ncbi:putative ABC transport system permease protein [Devosia lucknowensis]|uniref:Putative ABC transport system permease protein n=1 Tax=Devosia lucknowensis TaxID=1096929 RepID=A0A1Y6FDT2_9HYPH|nr:ABC transporter permease [Devosia lucknowensis]SMQ72927.1 putative ABC transport system permease protein [Devosia lucknowensis]